MQRLTGHPVIRSLFEIFLTSLYTNTLSALPVIGSFLQIFCPKSDPITASRLYLPSSSEFDPAVGSHCKIGQFSNADLFLKLYLSWMGRSRIRTENTIKCINGSRGTDHL